MNEIIVETTAKDGSRVLTGEVLAMPPSVKLASPGVDTDAMLLIGLALTAANLLFFAAMLFKRRRGGAAAIALFLVPGLAHAGTNVIPKDYDIVQAAMGTGDAIFFGGGDLFRQRLVSAREKLSGALELVGKGHEIHSLCNPKACGSGEASLCHALQGMTEAQAGECRAFITGKAEAMARANTDAVSPITVSAMPLTVGGVSVKAMTRREKNGSVIFHYGGASTLSDAGLVALLAHELGHKIETSGGFIADEKPAGGRVSGRLFLDAIGASLGLYALRNTPPKQLPPALPEALAGACAESGGRFLAGLSADVEGKAPEAATASRFERIVKEGQDRVVFIQGVLSGPAGRAETVARLFRKYLMRAPTVEETALMVGRLGEGVSYDALVASIMGDAEYMSSRGNKTADQFVVSAFLDVTGKSPTPQQMTVSLARLRAIDQATFAQSLFRESADSWGHLVDGWYADYLNRAPTAAEREAHVSRLRAGASWETARAYVLAEPEYAALQASRFNACRTASR